MEYLIADKILEVTSYLLLGFSLGLWIVTICGVHRFIKQNKVVKRLSNIHRVARDVFDHQYDTEEACSAAWSFILCESDLELKREEREV